MYRLIPPLFETGTNAPKAFALRIHQGASATHSAAPTPTVVSMRVRQLVHGPRSPNHAGRSRPSGRVSAASANHTPAAPTRSGQRYAESPKANPSIIQVLNDN